MLRSILVDDEPLIVNELKELLADNTYITVVGTYTNSMDALNELPNTKPDCAFLDIELPNVSGIDLAEQLISMNPAIKIVFVTAYNYYAAQAFDVSATDYLLKPIRPDRLKKAIEKMKRDSDIPKTRQATSCTIRCFGAFEVLIDGKNLKWGRAKSKEFLAYMLENPGKWVTKYKLCEEQWCEYSPEQALAYLQISVYQLRKALREAGCTQLSIKYSDDRYILRVGDVDWDVPNFVKAYDAFLQTKSKDAANEALRLYRGEYLEGEDYLWASIPREEYICKYENLCSYIKK